MVAQVKQAPAFKLKGAYLRGTHWTRTQGTTTARTSRTRGTAAPVSEQRFSVAIGEQVSIDIARPRSVTVMAAEWRRGYEPIAEPELDLDFEPDDMPFR